SPPANGREQKQAEKEKGEYPAGDRRPAAEGGRSGGGRRRGFRKAVPEGREIPREVIGRGVALSGILGEAALDDPAKRHRCVRADRADRGRLLTNDRGQRLDGRRPGKGALARCHLVED